MADKRMFSKQVLSSDSFLEMSYQAQALYIQLSLEADDDGFVSSPRKIARMMSLTDEYIEELDKMGFVICFKSGLLVIRHWKQNNNIRGDRYRPSIHVEKEKIYADEYDVYHLTTNRQPSDNQVTTNRQPLVTEREHSIDKVSIDKVSIEKKKATAKPPPSVCEKPVKHKRGEYKHVLLTDEELSKLYSDYGEEITAEYIKQLDEYLENNRKKHYNNHSLTIRNWLNKAGIKKLAESTADYEFAGW